MVVGPVELGDLRDIWAIVARTIRMTGRTVGATARTVGTTVRATTGAAVRAVGTTAGTITGATAKTVGKIARNIEIMPRGPGESGVLGVHVDELDGELDQFEGILSVLIARTIGTRTRGGSPSSSRTRVKNFGVVCQSGARRPRVLQGVDGGLDIIDWSGAGNSECGKKTRGGGNEAHFNA